MYAQSSLLKFIMNKKKQSKSGLIGGRSNGLQWNLGSLIKAKSGFLAAVFASLIFQLCVVFAIVKFIPDNDEFKKYSFLIFIIQIVLIICMAIVPMPMPIKFILFTLFSVLTGFVLKTALQKVSPEVIETAIIATITIFTVFVVLALVISGFGIDLGFLTLFLFGVLLLLVIVRIVMVLMTTSTTVNKMVAIISLIIFSMFIVFDTNQILQRDYHGDFITASLDYFLDVINIFLNLVSYMNNK